MPSFTGKTFSNFYKNLLGINQSGNTGVDATTRSVQDGAGNSSAISLSDDVLQVQPVNDNTAGAFTVKNKAGTAILSVDTQTSTGNSAVKCGTSQINALTTYKEFNNSTISPVAGYHYVLAPGMVGQSATDMQEWHLGNDPEPATTLDVSAETYDTNVISVAYWYLIDAITIDAAHIVVGGAGSPDSALEFHLMSYAIDTGSNFGDLSDGVVVADGGSVSAIDEDVIKVVSLSNLPTDVAAGRVILATVESDAGNIISCNMTVKYHIQ